eukprot:Tbor_TRINITY_DN2332_c0_g1::TRINITY_DN2332_c0_g1_i1::g.134::m.134/K03439/trmB, METTL1; tRNA (guanine-N7-)-methyltransferase
MIEDINTKRPRAATYASASSKFLVLEQPKWTRLPIRSRPHRNPLAENEDPHPECPADLFAMLPSMYPICNEEGSSRNVEFLDIGCAFGGMLFDLCPLYPNTLMLGLEIRSKVVDFARSKAVQLRSAALNDTKFHHYNNVWFDQLNVMKFGSNCFTKGQLSKIFFCYPDPHWKKKNIRRRIISPGLVQEYGFWLRVGGLIYTVSDVAGLENWMIECLDGCPLFERLSEEEIDNYSTDHRRVMEIVTSSSEDAQRTERKGLSKNYAVHRRIDPAIPVPPTWRSMSEV